MRIQSVSVSPRNRDGICAAQAAAAFARYGVVAHVLLLGLRIQCVFCFQSQLSGFSRRIPVCITSIFWTAAWKGAGSTCGWSTPLATGNKAKQGGQLDILQLYLQGTARMTGLRAMKSHHTTTFPALLARCLVKSVYSNSVSPHSHVPCNLLF